MIRRALGIFRKVVIVVLTLAAVGTGTSGVVVGSGCLPLGKMWFWGELDADAIRDGAPYGYAWVGWGASRHLSLSHVQYLDRPSALWKKRSSGPGWAYQTSVGQNLPTGLYFRSHKIMLSFVVLIVMFVLFAAYPTLALIRGPLRRWRRRKRRLCLRCGYDLRGNVSGVCPECGTAI